MQNVWNKNLSLQEALDLLQNLPSENSEALIDDFSDEEVPSNNLWEFSSDSEEDDKEIEQDPSSKRKCLKMSRIITSNSVVAKFFKNEDTVLQLNNNMVLLNKNSSNVELYA
ncbi:hypothetical protein TNCV_4778311 [Trichonephila clavipes]|nr:hypothetical protein TNCV_4778311 [Trichonephila clavipes]